MRALRFSYSFSTHTKICIIGGGAGGLNLSAHLLRKNIDPKDIRIFEPAQNHYYQPGFTMIGAGLCDPSLTVRKNSDILPKDCFLTKQRVAKVDAESNTIETDANNTFTYDHLIFASGLQLHWDKIQGAKEMLDNPNSKVGSIYNYKYASKMAKMGKQFKGGKAIFTEPPLPIKCAGAPQKILYLLTDQWQQKNIPCSVEYVKVGLVMFGVPKYSKALTTVAADYNIATTFGHNLVEVNEKEAIFLNVQTQEKISKKYDFLHLIPPMSAHKYIADSGLADQAGYVDLHKNTLRHNRFSNIWGLGDCTSLPNSKTAAAIFSQTEILVKNLTTVLNNPDIKQLPSAYQGYASCPLFVGKGKLMLAEFKYGGEVDETFLSNQEKPNRFFYLLKRYFFPQVYWHIVPRGLWGGRKGFKIDI